MGESGYIKEPYLITPILPTPVAGSREHNYNVVVSQTRNCIERTNGIIKAVFRCLRKDRVLHYQPSAAAYIIIACCTIYNMMHEYRLPFPDVDGDIAAEPVIDDDDAQPALAPRAAALRRQQEIIDLINQQM